MVKEDSTGTNKTGKWTQCYAGTYASENSRGVYRFSFHEETGRMTKPELFCEARNAKWVSIGRHGFAFPVERDKKAGLGLLEMDAGTVRQRHELLLEQQTPCYILQDKEYIYTANYHEGGVLIYSLEQGELKLVKRIECGEGAGCHQILRHGSLIMVPCLEQQKVRFFDRNLDFAPAGELRFPKDSGPRHGVFNQDHTKFYMVSEWSNELFAFEAEGQEFTLQAVLSILPPDVRGAGKGRGASAAIRLTKDESFLYISIRELDLLAVIDVRGASPRLIQHEPCQGSHPRDIILSRDEQFLLIANRFEGGIVSMIRDRNTGRLMELSHRVEMPQGVSLAY